MLPDEVAEIGFVAGADCLLILPFLRYEGPLHFHGILQEEGQFRAEEICGKHTVASSEFWNFTKLAFRNRSDQWRNSAAPWLTSVTAIDQPLRLSWLPGLGGCFQ